MEGCLAGHIPSKVGFPEQVRVATQLDKLISNSGVVIYKLKTGCATYSSFALD